MATVNPPIITTPSSPGPNPYISLFDNLVLGGTIDLSASSILVNGSSGSVDVSGNWTYNATLPLGITTFIVQAKNGSDLSTGVNYQVDFVPPPSPLIVHTPTLTTPINDVIYITNLSQITLSGAYDGTVSSVYVLQENILKTTTFGLGIWASTLSLNFGYNNFKIYGGTGSNYSTPRTLRVFYKPDYVPGTVDTPTITTPTTASTYEATSAAITIGGTYDPSAYSIFVNTSSGGVTSLSGNWSASYSIPHGQTVFTVIGKSKDGTTASLPATLTVNYPTPVTFVNQPTYTASSDLNPTSSANAYTTGEQSIVLSGTYDSTVASILVNGSPAGVTLSGGNWSFNATLGTGQNVFTIRGQNGSIQSTSFTIIITYATSAGAWSAVAGGPLFGKVVAPLADTANALLSILGPIQTILSIVQSILKVVRAFLLDFTSIILAVIQGIVDQITKFLDQLANSGIYILTIAPDISSETAAVASTKGGFDAFVTKIHDKFFDTADAQRPNFDPTQPCAAVAIGVTTGNLLSVIQFMSSINRAFGNLVKKFYKPPIISGFSGNNTNVIRMVKPNLPSDYWTNITYRLERAQQSGGDEIYEGVNATNAATKGAKTQELSRDTATHQKNRKYELIASYKVPNALFSPAQIIFIDGADSASAHLVRLNLSQQANNITSTSGSGIGANAANVFSASRASNLAGQTSQKSFGPKSFQLDATQIPGFPLSTVTISTASDIEDAITDWGAVGGDLKKNFRVDPAGTPANNYYADLRVNGVRIPWAVGDNAVTTGIGISAFDGKTITLTSNVPLGSTVELYSYAQVKAADLILLQDYNAGKVVGIGNASVYTKVISPGTGGVSSPAPDNGTTYFYRVTIVDESKTYSAQQPQADVAASSNEIRLTPFIGFAPTPVPAYCIGSKQGPFVITKENCYLDFNVGDKNFKVNLRLSRKNEFSSDVTDFNSSFGTLLPSEFAGGRVSGSSNTVNNLISKASGLQFQYSAFNGQTVNIFPGDYIPIEIQDVLADLRAQCHDKSVRFASKKGRIVVMDGNKRGVSKSQIFFNSPNTALGFSQGLCMGTYSAEQPDWTRYAVKDIIPYIYDVSELINNVAKSFLNQAESAVKALVDFIDLLSVKIQVIQDFLTQIQTLLQLLANLKLQVPNMYILRVNPVGGSKALAAAIQNASGRPLSSTEDLAAGVVLVVGGVNTNLIYPLLSAIL